MRNFFGASVLVTLCLGCAVGSASVSRRIYTASGKYLAVTFLDDSRVHFEMSAKFSAPNSNAPLVFSPMIAKTDHPGPSTLLINGTRTETARLTITVEPETLCASVFDKKLNKTLTEICPRDIENDWKGIDLTAESFKNIYGLGQQFRTPGQSEGDWSGSKRTPGDINGNQMVGFNGGANGNTQIPIAYFLGGGNDTYALFLDSVYKQEWDFTGSKWKIRTWGDRLSWIVLAADDLPSARKSYLDLVGHALVPPKKAFGLWVSEYGYRNWDEVRAKLTSLRQNHFPVDGFVLDLFWFGGVKWNSEVSSMGRLGWDETNFPSPKATLTDFRKKDGVGIVVIEEPYISKGLDEYRWLEQSNFLTKDREGKTAYLYQNPWWGLGGMIDYTNPNAGEEIFHEKRLRLISDGVMGHWTDLGEPEMYPNDGRYHMGVQADVHNIYNLKWLESIYRGYQKWVPEKRPFCLSRSGSAGIQRFGAAMWSADIGSNLDNLAAHFNAQMHMSLSGIDYYGADIGGFHRSALNGDLNEMYTQWFAAGMMVDVPGRPHTENLSKSKETSPDKIGDFQSNRENLRQRYAMIPYLYSLAHLANRQAEPVFPPLVYYFQNDERVRKMGFEKMIGPWLLTALAAKHGEYRLDVYLPKGTWINFHTEDVITSQGQSLPQMPLYYDGKLQLPLFARAGAILPLMPVDDQTMNAEGMRLDGTLESGQRWRIYEGQQRTEFTLYEDDGESTGYLKGAVAETRVQQEPKPEGVAIRLAPTTAGYAVPASRSVVIDFVSLSRQTKRVKLNGELLPEKRTESTQFDSYWQRLSPRKTRLVLQHSDTFAEKLLELELD